MHHGRYYNQERPRTRIHHHLTSLTKFHQGVLYPTYPLLLRTYHFTSTVALNTCSSSSHIGLIPVNLHVKLFKHKLLFATSSRPKLSIRWRTHSALVLIYKSEITAFIQSFDKRFRASGSLYIISSLSYYRIIATTFNTALTWYTASSFSYARIITVLPGLRLRCEHFNQMFVLQSAAEYENREDQLQSCFRVSQANDNIIHTSSAMSFFWS